MDIKYEIGNLVDINNKTWEINDIIYRFGIDWCYVLTRETKNGNIESMPISTGSLEMILD